MMSWFCPLTAKYIYERMIKYGAPHCINRHFSLLDAEPPDAVEV
jgi:hypothetical protein